MVQIIYDDRKKWRPTNKRWENLLNIQLKKKQKSKKLKKTTKNINNRKKSQDNRSWKGCIKQSNQKYQEQE